MGKQTFEEFSELIKDFTPDEIVENLKKVGGHHYRRVISHPMVSRSYPKLQSLLLISSQVLADNKNLHFRTTKHIYEAFKYLLGQESYSLRILGGERRLWLETMEFLELPSRRHVRYLPKDQFLEGLEHVMIRTKEILGIAKVERAGGKSSQASTGLPLRTDANLNKLNANFADPTISAEEWSKIAADEDPEPPTKNIKAREAVLSEK